MKKMITGAALGVLMFATAAPLAFAQTASSSAQALFDQIKALQAQIAALQAAQQQVQIAAQNVAGTLKLIHQLRQGMTSDDVKALQALLAADPTIYPEGKITGYFGPLTTKAVKKFQEKHGLEQVGNVGPKTLEKLNELLDEHPIMFEGTASTTATSTIGTGMMRRGENDQGDDHGKGQGEGGRLCAIVPPGHLIAPGWLKHHDNEEPIVPECQNVPKGIEDKLGERDHENEDQNATTTPPTPTPDTTAPVISATSVTTASTTATALWTTNEAATSKVYYGTTTPFMLGSALSVANTALVTAHSMALTGLTASTTYSYVIGSADASGNTATTTASTFTTTQ